MIDYHLHTNLCGHAAGQIKDYVHQAEKLGLNEIGFADHFPMVYQPEFSVTLPQLTMTESDIESYLQMIASLKSQVRIKKGFEIDYYEKDNLFFKKYNNLYHRLDFILGSVHFFDEVAFDQKEFKDERDKIGLGQVWKHYFQEMENMIKKHSSMIDVISHFDLPKKFKDPLPEDLTNLLDQILDLIKEREMVLEINTSGLFKPVNEFYPSLDIIKKAHQKGIEFTAGSDAHAPDQVARGFDVLGGVLEKVGIKRLIMFTGHKKDFFKI
ncbi:MAG: histidinol-phosphatase [Spirochaetes bacterium]|nr:histidinol-phosphatase [Spirochaetota bacterium]